MVDDFSSKGMNTRSKIQDVPQIYLDTENQAGKMYHTFFRCICYRIFSYWSFCFHKIVWEEMRQIRFMLKFATCK